MTTKASVLLLAALGCQATFTAPEGTYRITPPPEYRVWWDSIQPCVQKPAIRRYEAIVWYISPDLMTSTDGVEAAAITVENQVYVADLYRNVPWIIQHELVHAIDGIRGHPYDPFVKCNLMTWH